MTDRPNAHDDTPSEQPAAQPAESPVAPPGEQTSEPVATGPSKRLELLFVFLLWAVATLIIWRLAVGHVSPRRFQDEFLWSSVAESLTHGEWLHWRGESLGIKSPLYPLGIAPAYVLGGSTESIYHNIQFINSAMMCAVVFPVYYAARQYLNATLAFVTALLALAAPAMNYAGIIGTEALAYPMAAFAGLSIALVAGRADRKSWIVAAVAILLAILTRTQFVVFVPALLAAVLLTGLMRAPAERRVYFAQQAAPLKILGGLMAAGLALVLFAPGAAVGLYQEALQGGVPDLGELWFWLRAFTADVFIVGGIIPVIAAIAMMLDRDNRRDPMVGALLATALVVSAAFVAEVSWFSANNEFDWRARHIFYERYMFYLGPLFFVTLMTCWQRIKSNHVLVATGIAVLGLSGIHADLVLVPFSYDAFGLTVVGWLLDTRPGLSNHLGLYMASVGVILGWVLTMAGAKNEQLARIGAMLALALTFGVLLWNQAKTWQYARFYSPIAFSGVPKPVDWIDQKTGEDVGMIITSTDQPEMYFGTEFWNKRITRAFATDQEPFKSPVMYSPRCEFDWAPDGTILGTGCDQVPRAFYIRSNTVAVHLKDPVLEFENTPDQRLLIAERPVRLLSILSGRDVTTGEAEGGVDLRTFLDRRAVVRLRVKSPRGAARVVVGDRSYDVPAGRATTVSFPVASGEQLTGIQFVDRRKLEIKVEIPSVDLVLDPGDVRNID